MRHYHARQSRSDVKNRAGGASHERPNGATCHEAPLSLTRTAVLMPSGLFGTLAWCRIGAGQGASSRLLPNRRLLLHLQCAFDQPPNSGRPRREIWLLPPPCVNQSVEFVGRPDLQRAVQYECHED
jgi:hypothetical protein